MKRYPLQAERNAAVDWWCGALRNPRHRAGDLLLNLMGVAIPCPEIPEPILRRFACNLRRALGEALQESPGQPLTLDSDYGPDRMLADALVTAGGNQGMYRRFPWKTIMVIQPGSVVVKCGYGAAPVELSLE